MKTVLITGSSRGIGRETAIYFAQQGWNVIIHGFRHPEKLESLKNEILEENRITCIRSFRWVSTGAGQYRH